jgi:hypothetical protein
MIVLFDRNETLSFIKRNTYTTYIEVNRTETTGGYEIKAYHTRDAVAIQQLYNTYKELSIGSVNHTQYESIVLLEQAIDKLLTLEL